MSANRWLGIGVRVGSCILALGVLAEDVRAQQPTDDFGDVSSVVVPGDEVTVVGVDGERTNGRVVDLSPGAIAIATKSSPQGRVFPAPEVGRIVKRDPVGNGVRSGAIIGGIGGLVGGLLVNAICVNETGGCPGAVILLTAAGAAGGAAAGWGFDNATGNEVVYEITAAGQGPAVRVALPGERTLELWGGFVGGRNYPTGALQPSISGGIGLRFPSGVSVEAEVDRTLRSGTEFNPCVTLPVALGGGNCLGSGEQGMQSMLRTTSRIVYNFSKSRFQPFVSGGVTYLSGVLAFPDSFSCCVGNPQVTQQYYDWNAFYLPVGGGVRVELVRGLLLRPEFVYYIDPPGGNENRQLESQASVGVYYRFGLD